MPASPGHRDLDGPALRGPPRQVGLLVIWIDALPDRTSGPSPKSNHWNLGIILTAVRQDSVKKVLGRLWRLSPEQAIRTVALSLYTEVASRLPDRETHSVTEHDIEQWFGPKAPVLYHPGFGHEVGPPLGMGSGGEVPPDPNLVGRDPRVRWEADRDQDLTRIAASMRIEGPSESDRAIVEARLAHFLTTPPPNAMEAALRCITWLE